MISQKWQKTVLVELHRDHPGIVHMKEVTCSYAWWEGMDKDKEALVKSYKFCPAVHHQWPHYIPGFNWPMRP